MILEPENITIAHYQIKHMLARGGMSSVYLAHDLQTNRDVAIKLVHDSEYDYYERFRREAKTITSLEHDHILPAFDYGKYGSWFYMVMPYVEYGTLRDHLDAGPLTPKAAGKILIQLADAIQCAHNHNIVHRDIKPSNVLLRDGEHVYLADFGLVRNVEEMSGITQTGYLLGTPEYMAPELTDNRATPASDIYALGIVLYQMLTGCVPFKASSPIGICLKHIEEQPVLPSVYNPALSQAIDSVVLRALAKNPEQRFQSANDLAQAYQEALKGYTSENVIQQGKLRRHALSVYALNRTKPKISLSILTAALLLLFIVPMLLDLSSAYVHGRTQLPMFLGGSGSFNGKDTLTKPPSTQITPIARKTPSPTHVPTHHRSINTNLPVSSHSDNHSGKSGGNGKGNKVDGNGKGNERGGKGAGHNAGDIKVELTGTPISPILHLSTYVYT